MVLKVSKKLQNMTAFTFLVKNDNYIKCNNTISYQWPIFLLKQYWKHMQGTKVKWLQSANKNSFFHKAVLCIKMPNLLIDWSKPFCNIPLPFVPLPLFSLELTQQLKTLWWCWRWWLLVTARATGMLLLLWFIRNHYFSLT